MHHNYFVATLALLEIEFQEVLMRYRNLPIGEEDAYANSSEPVTPKLLEPFNLIVVVKPNGDIMLNNDVIGTAVFPNQGRELTARLVELFYERKQNRAYKVGLQNRIDLSDDQKIERTVWLVASATIPKNKLDSVRQAIDITGATPVKMLSEERYKKYLEDSEKTRAGYQQIIINGKVQWVKIQ